MYKEYTGLMRKKFQNRTLPSSGRLDHKR